MYLWSADAVPLLVAPPTETNRLRQLLLELGCLIKITEILNILQDEVQKVGHTHATSLVHTAPPLTGPHQAVCVSLLCTAVHDCCHARQSHNTRSL